MKNKNNTKKIIFAIVLIICLVGLILIYKPKQNKDNEHNLLEDSNIEIEVRTNDDGLQETGNINNGSNINSVSGAATVDEMSGSEKTKNGNIEDILKDKEIEIK